MSVVNAGKRRSAGSGSKEAEAETGKGASNKRAAQCFGRCHPSQISGYHLPDFLARSRMVCQQADLFSTGVAGDDAEVDNGKDSKDSEPDPLTPAFLLQLIKLLKKKESLLERAKQHNDHMKVIERSGSLMLSPKLISSHHELADLKEMAGLART